MERTADTRLLAATLVLSLFTTAAIFGLGRSEQAAPAARMKLRVAWWGSQARHERTIRVLQMFEREHPAIDIDYQYAGSNDYWTMLITLAAGNDLPDVMQQDYQYLTEWVGRGLIVPLDDQAASGALDLSDAAESSLAGGASAGSCTA